MNFEKLDRYLKFLDLPSTPLVGVDISFSNIKLVELSKNRQGVIKLENYAIEPTPSDAFDDNGINNADSLGSAIQRGWSKLGTKVKNVAIAIPSNQAISRTVKLSKDLDDLALSEEVLNEARNFSSFTSSDEFNLDWVVLGPNATHPDTHQDVYICVTRRSVIVDYSAAIESAGLKVVIIDVDDLAQQYAFKCFNDYTSPPAEVTAMINAGQSSVQIKIYDNTPDKKVLFTKEINIGLTHLTDKIASYYDLPLLEAQKAQRNQGEGLTDYHEAVLYPFLNTLAEEILRHLQFFLTSASFEKIDRLLLTGGCANLPHSTSIIQQINQIKTEVFNPFIYMEKSSKIKDISFHQDLPILTTACGLALRKFD